MKFLIKLLILIFSGNCLAERCPTSESIEYAMGSGYLGFLDHAIATKSDIRDASPIIFWERADAIENDVGELPAGSAGSKVLSSESMYKDALKELKNKNATVYVLVWNDEVFINQEKEPVLKLNIGLTKTSYSLIAAMAVKNNLKRLPQKVWELGCGINLLR